MFVHPHLHLEPLPDERHLVRPIPDNIIQYSTVQCSAVQYSTVQYWCAPYLAVRNFSRSRSLTPALILKATVLLGVAGALMVAGAGSGSSIMVPEQQQR